MEPLHRKSDELNYELAIRRIFNVENQRIKTSKLRELLKSEREGTSVAPASSLLLHTASEEMDICQLIYKDIIEVVEQGDCTDETLKGCASRLRHLGNRINRIQTTTATQETNVLDLGHCVSDAIMKVEGQETISKRVASNEKVPSLETDSDIQLGAQAMPPLASNNLSDTIPQNVNAYSQIFVDLLDEDETNNFDRRLSNFNNTYTNLKKKRQANFLRKLAHSQM